MIERTDSDGIVTLRLAHGKVSAMDLELCEELRRQLDASRHARALILTGTGSSFSAGVDLFRLIDGGAAYLERFWPALSGVLDTLFVFPRPVVAAVNGHAIAGGCFLAASCDYRLMSGGKIGVPELLVGVPFPTVIMEILKFVDVVASDSFGLKRTGFFALGYQLLVCAVDYKNSRCVVRNQ
jgi:enoyl-CoA hydratase